MTALTIAAVALVLSSAPGATPAQTHADCFTKRPNGNILLHPCRRKATKDAERKAPRPAPRKILVVPTGREFEI